MSVGTFEARAVHSGCGAGLQEGLSVESSSICHGDGNSLDSFPRLTYCARCSGTGLTCAAKLVLCAERLEFSAPHLAGTTRAGDAPMHRHPCRLIKRRPCPRAQSRHEHERIQNVRSHQDRR
jgi:hypothetical protein